MPLDESVEHLERAQVDGLIAAAGVDGTNEILAAFWKSTEELFDSLASQIHDNMLDIAAQTSHAIKGSAANVGAVRLARTAAEMETACKAGDVASAAELAGAARRDFDAVRQVLADYLKQSA